MNDNVMALNGIPVSIDLSVVSDATLEDVKLHNKIRDDSKPRDVSLAKKVLEISKINTKGGPGSGNFGHLGRPGKVGGSVTNDNAAFGINGGSSGMFERVIDEWDRRIQFSMGDSVSVKDFSPDKEEEIVNVSYQTFKDILGSPDGQRLARELGEPFYEKNKESLRHMIGKKIVSSIVYTLDDKDAGMGSGGEGGAKVFWLPYTNKRGRIAGDKDVKYGTFNLDPLYVYAHELHHALGSTTEFDTWSQAVGIAFHLADGNVLNQRIVDDAIYSKATWAFSSNVPRKYAKYKREGKAVMRFLYGRYPKLLVESLGREYGKDVAQEKIRSLINADKNA